MREVGGERGVTPAEPDAFKAGVAAFGHHLRQERELRGLGRDEVVRVTRLPPALVEALESGQPERMPPRAYVLGYLRTYAGAVGLDPDDIVLRWQEVAGAEELTPARRRVPLLPALVAAVLVLTLAALLFFTFVGPQKRRLALPRPGSAERASAERAPAAPGR